RAAGYAQPRVEEAPLAIAPRRPLRPEGREHAVADLRDEAPLGYWDHAERGEAADVLRAAHAAVLDAVAVIGARMRRERVRVDVEHGGDGAVADGVGPHLPARAMGPRDDPAEALDVRLEETPVAGLALEVAAHGRGAADQRSVGEHLHGADAE